MKCTTPITDHITVISSGAETPLKKWGDSNVLDNNLNYHLIVIVNYKKHTTKLIGIRYDQVYVATQTTPTNSLQTGGLGPPNLKGGGASAPLCPHCVSASALADGLT